MNLGSSVPDRPPLLRKCPYCGRPMSPEPTLDLCEPLYWDCFYDQSRWIKVDDKTLDPVLTQLQHWAARNKMRRE